LNAIRACKREKKEKSETLFPLLAPVQKYLRPMLEKASGLRILRLRELPVISP
jgi:hypothetical protein